MSLAWILLGLGLFPSYVSIFIVEKHYTAFWTGFWNIYGLFLTSVGLALDNYNPLAVWLLFGLVVFIIIVLYAGLAPQGGHYSPIEEAEAYILRRFGASWVTTSINWGLYIGFTVGLLWGVAIMIVHGLLMIGLAAALE